MKVRYLPSLSYVTSRLTCASDRRGRLPFRQSHPHHHLLPWPGVCVASCLLLLAIILIHSARSMVLAKVMPVCMSSTLAKTNLQRTVQKTTMWLRIFSQMAKNVGYSGTWGPGEISQGNIHVKDCASALVLLLEAALAGKAGEGKDGLCEYIYGW